MGNIVLVLDESGAKGYSNNTETYPGELGVMAGYLIPKFYLDIVKTDLDTIRSHFFVATGKMHITDLQPDQQEILRREIFDYFIQKKIHWVYEAIYVQGFFESASFLNRLTQRAHQSRVSNIQISWREKRELLHAELFQGVFGKAVAFVLGHAGKKASLEVITDRTDPEIIEKFKAEAESLIRFEPSTTTPTTGFDRSTGQVVRGSITIEKNVSPDVMGDFSGVTYSINCEDSSLTFAADVLVNSVNYHLKSYQSASTGIPLNTQKAISGHALETLVYGALDEAQGKAFADMFYMHPTEKSHQERIS